MTADTACAHCGATGPDQKACAGCQLVHYCNGNCQKCHWKEQHKPYCPKLMSINEIFEDTESSYYDAFPLDGDAKKFPVRKSPKKAFSCASDAEDAAEFVVGTDTARVRFASTALKGGQYYRPPKNSGSWQHFPDARHQSFPGNKGGHFASVIDTEQPGSSWVLSAQGGYFRHGNSRSHAPLCIYLSRADYRGFTCPRTNWVYDNDGGHRHINGKQIDQYKGHFKVAGMPLLDTGRILISDLSSAGTDGKSLHTNGKDRLDSSCVEVGQTDYAGGISVHTVGDGYYSISLHRDSDGKIDLITVSTC